MSKKDTDRFDRLLDAMVTKGWTFFYTGRAGPTSH